LHPHENANADASVITNADASVITNANANVIANAIANVIGRCHYSYSLDQMYYKIISLQFLLYYTIYYKIKIY
jgi:hypothetical protein